MTESSARRLDELEPKTPFKHYQLLEQIGLGGQGVVWSALDTAGNRLVAIKFHEPVGAEDTGRLLEFERQVRLLTPLDHPNILPVYESGRSGQMHYLVSPYAAGGTLRELLDSTPLSHADILSITAEVVSALEYLHARNIIHRDLKPSNIFLDFDRHAYLADFGLARVISATTVALHTGRGTLPYAPPEQHSMAELTPQSDIYSLGVMLYEMFTRQLPWDGEKTLGIQQLHSDDALPDPIDFAPDAPRELASVLRTLTAADPSHRPGSAAEAFGLLQAILPERRPADEAKAAGFDSAEGLGRGVQTLLERGAGAWKLSVDRFPLTLTKFVLIDLGCTIDRERGLTDEQSRFLLTGALTFDYRLEHWWPRVAAQDRLAVCARLIENGTPVIAGRVVNRLYADLARDSGDERLPPSAVRALIQLAGAVADLSDRALRLARALTAPASRWQEERFGPVEDQTLATLALSDGPQAVEAARLVGHIRSTSAVRKIMDGAADERLLPTLVAVQQTAGGLPPSLPSAMRVQVLGEALWRQLAMEPRALIRSFAATALGGLLGFGSYVYITYRLPSFMDMARLLIALERGLFLGVLVGAGLFLTRLVVQRWRHLSVAPRLVVATGLGGLLISSALSLHSLLFLGRAPEGWVMLLGSAILALGTALGAASGRRRWAAMLIGLIAASLALALTWVLHLATGMHPVLFYEYAWPPAQTALVILVTALPLAIGANLFDTALTEDFDGRGG